MRRFKRRRFRKRFRRFVRKAMGRRRSFRGRRKFNRPTTTHMRTTIPDKLTVVLRFWGDDTLTTSGAAGSYAWGAVKGNSLHNVDSSGGSGNPGLTFIYTQLYNFCYVKASKIRLSMVTNSVNLGDVTVCLLRPDPKGSPPVSSIAGTKPQEQAYTKMKEMLSQVAGSSGRCTFHHYMTTKKLLGGRFDPNGQTCTAAADPSSVWYWSYAASNFGTAATIRVTYMVKLYCTFFDRVWDTNVN